MTAILGDGFGKGPKYFATGDKIDQKRLETEVFFGSSCG